MNKKYIDILLDIFFIILSALLYGSADTVNQAVSKASTDSTSTYVNTLAIILGTVALIDLAKSIISSPKTIEFAKNPKKFFTLIFLLIGYVWIMEYVGFIIGSMLFLPSTMYLMGYKKIINALIISAGITLGVYLLFQVGFEILLPEATIFQGVE